MRQARTNKKRKLNRFAIVLDSLMAIHNFSEAGFLWLKGLARPAGRMLEGRLTCPEPRSVCTKSRVEFDVAVRHGQSARSLPAARISDVLFLNFYKWL
jgi:hypothetical protein